MTFRLLSACLFVVAPAAAWAAEPSAAPDQKTFLEWLHHANQDEIQAGQLETSRGASSSAKQYAQDMVKDHTAADEKVLAFARKHNLTLAAYQPTTELEKACAAADAATDNKLKQMQGEALDQAYLDAQLTDHDAVISKVKEGSDAFKGSDLSTLLKSLLPTLQKHRTHAYTLLAHPKSES